MLFITGSRYINGVTSYETLGRPSVDQFGLYIRFSRSAMKNHDLGENGGFGVNDPLTVGWGKCPYVDAQIRTGTRRLTYQTW
jgi:hypothetical protein